MFLKSSSGENLKINQRQGRTAGPRILMRLSEQSLELVGTRYVFSKKQAETL